jgi:hypothetical protein
LNQILALVARGLCDSQVVMMFLNCVLVVASLVSYGGCSGLLALKKKNGHGVLVVCNLHMELLNKIAVEPALPWFVLGLASLLKLVITVA